jgi:hypothetical protein
MSTLHNWPYFLPLKSNILFSKRTQNLEMLEMVSSTPTLIALEKAFPFQISLPYNTF